MVDQLDNRGKQEGKHMDSPNNLSLGTRVTKFVQKTLRELSRRKDTLTAKVVLKTNEELSQLHSELETSTSQERAQIAAQELQKLQKSVDQRQQDTNEVIVSQQDGSNISPKTRLIQKNNLAPEVDSSSLSKEALLIGRAEAANAVADRIENELFNSKYWSLL